MLDCLKKVNNIIILFLLIINICYASIKEENTIILPWDDVIESSLNKVGRYIGNHKWNLDYPNYDEEVLEIHDILNGDGIKFKDMYILISKYIMTETKKTYGLMVIVLVKGIESNWMGQWIIINDETKEIIKRYEHGSDPLSE